MLKSLPVVTARERQERLVHIAVLANLEIHWLTKGLIEENARLEDPDRDEFEDLKTQAVVRAFADRLQSLSSVMSSALDDKFDGRSETQLRAELTGNAALRA